jgi:hypothetical protein
MIMGEPFINSIPTSNPIYIKAVEFGHNLLGKIGYIP